ncbi:MAG: trigger factor [Planctomycetota bacterium]
MADEQNDNFNPTITVTDAGPCAKKVAIEVSADDIEAHLGESLDTLAVEAEIPGFRKGRAPKRLVEKRFGDAVRSEAKNQIVSQAYAKAVEDNELKVVGEPIADQLADLELEDGKPLAFEVEVEVMPEFDLPELEGIKVAKPLVTVEDEQVDKELDRLCLTEGDLEERDASEANDYLTGRAVMKGSDGTVHYDIDGAVVQVPEDASGMILGVLVDDLAKQLGKPKPSETAEIKTKGPEQHEIEAVRGDDVVITFEVQRVDRIVPIEAATLSERLGFPNVDELKDRIRSQLFDQLSVRQQVAMRQQLAKHLRESVEFDLPERLTTSQAERGLQRRRLELMYRGIREEQIEQRVAELRNASQEAAAAELKLFFILARVAEEMDVGVTEGDVNSRILQLARSRNQRPEQLRQQLIQSNQIGQVVQQIREHKALDALLAKAEVEEISLDEYNKRFGDDADAAVED